MKQNNTFLLSLQPKSWLFRYYVLVATIYTYKMLAPSNNNNNNKGLVFAFTPKSTSTLSIQQKQQHFPPKRAINKPRSSSCIIPPLFVTINDSYNNDEQQQHQQQQQQITSTTTLEEESTTNNKSYDLLELVYGIVQAADGRKAENIRVLEIAPISTICSYMVLVTGNSRPQNEAIASAVEDYVQDTYNNMLRPVGRGVPEGTAASGWIIIDYGSVMVQIMTPKSRLYYNIEGQWQEKGATFLDLTNYIIPNKVVTEEDTTDIVIDKDESDPFWS